MTTAKPRKKTRVWQDEAQGDWRYKVSHPDGHHATGTGHDSEKAAKEAAKTVEFAKGRG